MNLATHIPAPAKSVLPGAWKENDRIRTRAVERLLVDAAIANGAKRYVQEAIAFMYDGPRRRMDRRGRSARHGGVRVAVVRDAEAQARAVHRRAAVSAWSCGSACSTPPTPTTRRRSCAWRGGASRRSSARTTTTSLDDPPRRRGRRRSSPRSTSLQARRTSWTTSRSRVPTWLRCSPDWWGARSGCVGAEGDDVRRRRGDAHDVAVAAGVQRAIQEGVRMGAAIRVGSRRSAGRRRGDDRQRRIATGR